MYILLGSFVIATAAFAWLLWASENKRREIAAQLEEERLRRIAWERAAGLPFWSDEETEKALWVRASLGDDEMAQEVIETIYIGDRSLL